MKSLFYCAALITLFSCGRATEESKSQVYNQALEQFDMPALGIQKNITIDATISTLYEDMTIKSKKEENILGDEAFYIMVNENVYPSYFEMKLNFYGQTKINNIFYFNIKNSPISPWGVRGEDLIGLKMKEATNYFRDGLVWGKRNLDNPENDMDGKAFVIKTEEVAYKDQKEFTSQSTYLVWFECSGNVKMINDLAYSCGKYNLKFYYKLLDYSLNSSKL